MPGPGGTHERGPTVLQGADQPSLPRARHDLSAGLRIDLIKTRNFVLKKTIRGMKIQATN